MAIGIEHLNNWLALSMLVMFTINLGVYLMTSPETYRRVAFWFIVPALALIAFSMVYELFTLLFSLVVFLPIALPFRQA